MNKMAILISISRIFKFFTKKNKIEIILIVVLNIEEEKHI